MDVGASEVGELDLGPSTPVGSAFGGSTFGGSTFGGLTTGAEGADDFIPGSETTSFDFVFGFVLDIVLPFEDLSPSSGWNDSSSVTTPKGLFNLKDPLPEEKLFCF